MLMFLVYSAQLCSMEGIKNTALGASSNYCGLLGSSGPASYSYLFGIFFQREKKTDQKKKQIRSSASDLL